MHKNLTDLEYGYPDQWAVSKLLRNIIATQRKIWKQIHFLLPTNLQHQFGASVPALNEVQFYHNSLVEVLSASLFLLMHSLLLVPLYHTHYKDK